VPEPVEVELTPGAKVPEGTEFLYRELQQFTGDPTAATYKVSQIVVCEDRPFLGQNTQLFDIRVVNAKSYEAEGAWRRDHRTADVIRQWYDAREK